MKKYFYTTVALFAFAIAMPVNAATDTMQTTEVQNAFASWRTALSGQDPQKIVDLYDKEAILLATLAEKPIKSQEDRLVYFKGLTANPNLAAKVDEEYVRVLDDNTALVSGVYTFSFDKDGKATEIPARYTFVYEKMGDKWMIVEHHSSMVPKQ